MKLCSTPFRLYAGAARVIAIAMLASLNAGSTAAARKSAPVSGIVVDASDGHVLFASNADRARSPASLAKLMTLLLAFDALDRRQLKQRDQLVMTAEGARQAPSRLGLAEGRSISVSNALRATAVISANDIAVAFADRLGGNETAFVRMMNREANRLGMKHTHFGNATGLGSRAGTTTARDLATLSRYLIGSYPRRYRLFATRSIRWGGRVRPNHNRLLGKVAGLDGLKTGYTVQAGFNLAASARRGTKRIVVVVMGERSIAARDVLVSNLIESGFTSPTRRRPQRR